MELYSHSRKLETQLKLLEQSLTSFLPEVNADPLKKELFESMKYSLADGGKRIRGMLLLEFSRVCGGDVLKALPFAAAVEMIHSYSLVHDDLPAMDNSDFRRGKPSTHKAFGETTALLTGDALLNLAFETMLSPQVKESLGSKKAMEAAFCLAHNSGVFGMIGGQTIDLKIEGDVLNINIGVLEQLQKEKTSALIAAACEIGSIVAGADEKTMKIAREYGFNLGRTFQIIDDLLDFTSNKESLGKPVGSDTANEKVTYVTLLGKEKAEQLAKEYTRKALLCLDNFENNKALVELTKKLLVREK